MLVHRIYQKSHEFQRVTLTIPASLNAWVDTGLDPRVMGTRPVGCMWHAKVAHQPEKEPAASFRQRLSDVRVRFVPGGRVTGSGRFHVYVNDGARDTPVLPPLKEMHLGNGHGIRLRFPMSPGRIEVRLAGARPSDLGNVRIAFGLGVAAPDDFPIEDALFDEAVAYDVKGVRDFPLPPLPDPHAGNGAARRPPQGGPGS
jgi:hypothetical protein